VEKAKSTYCFISSGIVILLFFALSILPVSYSQQCYPDPDNPSKPCEETEEKVNSMPQNGLNETKSQDQPMHHEQSSEKHLDGTKNGAQEKQPSGNQKATTKSADNLEPELEQNSRNISPINNMNSIPRGILESIISTQSYHCISSNNSNGQILNSNEGNLDLKFYWSKTDLIHPVSIQISPNPYTLDPLPVILRDNKQGDCSAAVGDISISKIQFSLYTITELNEKGVVLRSFQIPLTKQLPNIYVNIHNRNFSEEATDFEVIPNQYLIQVEENVTDDVSKIASEFATMTNSKILKIFENSKAFAFTIGDSDMDKIEKALTADPRFKVIEQNMMGRIAQIEKSQAVSSGFQRVTSGTSQLSLSSLESGNDKIDVDIAVLDTGIDLDHPDLNVYKNVTFINGTFSGNDDNGHGSEVAGIAAARNNDLGMVGMAPGARLWSIKVCAAAGNCPLDTQLEGLEYAITHANEIDVINISIENRYSSILNAAIERATQKGIVVIAASGNDAKDAGDISPANSPDVIAVSGLADSDGKCGGLGPVTSYGEDDTLANFSNFGEIIDIASPAVDILTTYNNSDYSLDSGTSFAAPFVSGAAAVIKSQNSTIPVNEVRDQIINIGTPPLDTCDGKARGYFLSDPDAFREHLLYMDSTLDGSSANHIPSSIGKKIQSVILKDKVKQILK
jgi:subtilisin family serine protease